MKQFVYVRRNDETVSDGLGKDKERVSFLPEEESNY
jgi:hypothetical protein